MKRRRILTYINRSIFILLAGTFLLGILASFAVSLPPVQNRLVRLAQFILQRELGAKVVVREVDLGLPTHAILEGVSVYDQQGQEAIYLGEFRLNALTFSLASFIFNREESQELYVDYLKLHQPVINLYKREKDGELNINFLFGEKQENDTTLTGNSLRLRFPKVSITDGVIRLRDSTHARRDSTFDRRVNFQNLQVSNLQADLALTFYHGKKWATEIRKMSMFEDCASFQLENLSGNIQVDSLKGDPFVSVENFILQAEGSRVNMDAYFPKSTFGDIFGEDGNAGFMTLRNSTIRFGTISYFLRKPLELAGAVTASGNLRGNVKQLQSSNLRLAYLDSTRLNVDIKLTDLTEVERLDMDIQLLNSKLRLDEIDSLLTHVNFPQGLHEMGTLDLDANFEGTYYDFQVQTNINSNKGQLDGQLSMFFPLNDSANTYSGAFATTDFDLNTLLGLEGNISDRLNARFEVNGQGYSLTELAGRYEMWAGNSNILGSVIDSSHIQVTALNQNLNSLIDIWDRQGIAHTTFKWDLKETIPRYQLKGELKSMDLQQFGVSPTPIWIDTQYEVDMRGESVSEWIGNLAFQSFSVYNPLTNKRIPFQSWSLSADTASGSRRLNLNSEMGKVNIQGEYTYEQAIDRVFALIKETRLYFSNSDSLLNDYYEQKPTELEPVSFGLTCETYEGLNPLLEVLNLPLAVSPGAQLSSSLSFSAAHFADINISADSISYNGQRYLNPQSNLFLAKFPDSTEVDLAGEVRADTMYIGPSLKLEDVSVSMDGAGSSIESFVFAQQKAVNNRLQINLLTTFFENGKIASRMDSVNSYLVVNRDTFSVGNKNQFSFFNKRLEVENFALRHLDRSLLMYGAISPDKDDFLEAELLKLELTPLNEILGIEQKILGQVNTHIIFSSLLAKPYVLLKGSILDFRLDGYRYGDIRFNSDWKDVEKELYLDAKIVQDGEATLNLLGYYRPENEASALAFRVLTQNPFPLAYITPLVDGQLYDLSGEVALESFTIQGSLDDPIISGTGHFENATFGIDYFKTTYSFNASIEFDRDRITFPRIKLTDKYNRTADLYGVIKQRGFKEWDFDLQMDRVRDFLIMDTEKEDNNLFYGKIYLKNGIASITGDLDKLDIQAYVMAGANSILKIPVSENDIIDRPEFIQFVGDEVAANIQRSTGLKGFQLNLTVAATEEAQVDLIFDEKVGDIIRGRGNGTLNLNIDKNGDFFMFGNYEIAEGEYLFTSQNIINKKFSVKRGGTVTWSGDPYDAQLDLFAAYPVYADIKELIQSENSLRIPVNVLMNLQGSLLQPEINLSLELPNLTNQEASQIISYVKTIQYDEQELNKQVFSLMVFNRFAPIGGSLGSELGNTGVTTSVSELISNQVNYWLSQAMNDKLSVNINTNNFQDVNLLISAKLFNDRVRIERNGAIVATDRSNASLGDISVIIKLLPSEQRVLVPGERPGELVLEVFNRESLDASLQNTNQTGVGVFFKKDFDNLIDLLKKRKKPLNKKK
ncbi:MAG: translocation/assembly module TamB domain-containing protein [Bacteroidota bacterium]